MMEDRWLSVDEIAEYLGVVKASTYRWIEQKAASSRQPRPRDRR